MKSLKSILGWLICLCFCVFILIYFYLFFNNNSQFIGNKNLNFTVFFDRISYLFDVIIGRNLSTDIFCFVLNSIVLYIVSLKIFQFFFESNSSLIKYITSILIFHLLFILIIFSLNLIGFIFKFSYFRIEYMTIISGLLLVFVNSVSLKVNRVRVDLYRDNNNKKWTVFLISLSVFLILINLFYCLQYSLMGADALEYHFPISQYWFHLGKLSLDFPDFRIYLPGNSFLILSYFSNLHSIHIFTYIHYLYFVLSALMVFIISNYTFKSVTKALYSIIIFLSIPSAFFDSITQTNDYILWFFLLSSLFFFMKWYNEESKPVLFIFGSLLCGFALGVKIFVLYFIPFLLLLIFFKIFKLTKSFKNSTVPYLKYLLLLIIFMSVCSSYWFIRNTIYKQNPFYPVDMKIAGKHIFKGPWDENFLKAGAFKTKLVKLETWSNIFIFPFLERQYDMNIGVGPIVLFSFYLTLFFIIGKLYKWKQLKEDNKTQIIILLFISVLIFSVIWMAKTDRELRYNFYSFSVLAILFPLTFDFVENKVGKFIINFLLMFCFIFFIFYVFFMMTYLYCGLEDYNVKKMILFRGDTYDTHYFPKIPDFFPNGTKILTLFKDLKVHAFLYGSGLQNEVLYDIKDFKDADYVACYAREDYLLPDMIKSWLQQKKIVLVHKTKKVKCLGWEYVSDPEDVYYYYFKNIEKVSMWD